MVKVYKQLKKVGYPSLAVEGNSHAIPTEFIQMEGPIEFPGGRAFFAHDNGHLFISGDVKGSYIAAFAPGEWSHVEVS